MSDYSTPEGLRSLLLRLEAAGDSAWRTDPEAEELMAYTIRKYRPLAAKHHCEPDDSAFAAFEAFRTAAVRNAVDPWAVVTRAVQVTLIAEERANGLLCSPTRARRAHVSRHHDVRRFGESDHDLAEFHPALRVVPDIPEVDAAERDPAAPTTAHEAFDMTIALFVALGWPADTTTCALDYVAARLMESGDRFATHATLRRDENARALLDLDRRAWAVLLRRTLGNPHMDVRRTNAGHGLVLRLLIGHPLVELLAEDDLVREISSIAPQPVRRCASAS